MQNIKQQYYGKHVGIKLEDVINEQRHRLIPRWLM